MEHVEINRGLVAVNAASSVLTRIVTVGVLLWVNQFLLQRLDAADYAPFPVVTALFLFLQIFTAGFAGGLGRYVTEAYARGDRRGVTEIVSSMAPLNAGVAVAFLLLGVLACWQAGALVTIRPSQLGEVRLMLGILMLGNAVALVASPFTLGLFVRQKFVLLNVIRLGEQILRAALLLILLLGVSTKVLWVVVATVGALLVSTAATVAVSRRLIPELRFEWSAFRRATARQITSFGAWIMLGNLLWRIRTSADTLVLNHFSSATDVVSFSLGRLPDRQVEGVVSVAGVTLQPALTAMHASDRETSLRNAYLRGSRYYLWVGLAIAMPLIVFCRELVTLYVGEQYLMAAAVVALVSAGYPLRYASEILYRVAVARARVRAFLLGGAVVSAAQVILAVVLTAKFGLGAVAVAASALGLTIVSQLGFFWPLGLRMVGLPFRRYLTETLVPGYLPALGSAFVGFVMGAILPPDSWLVMGIDVAAMSAAYVLLLLLFSRPDDRKDLRLLVTRVRGRLGRKDRGGTGGRRRKTSGSRLYTGVPK